MSTTTPTLEPRKAPAASQRQTPVRDPQPRGMYANLFYRALADNRRGRLEIRHSDGSVHTLGGDKSGMAGERARPAVLEVRDPEFFQRAVLYGEIGFGESYMLGEWDTPDLTAALQWFMDNSESTPTFSRNLARNLIVGPLGFLDRVGYLLRPNSKKTAVRNISEHYDLSNDFFQLWLDSTMAYSAGVYASPDNSLHESQLLKFKIMAEKLQLGPGKHLLEIGCGWGGFACYAARHYGCKVTGVTISREQLEFARERVRNEGLEDLIDLRFQDYRDIQGKFDRIVSIEMVEALGYEYFDVFFGKCEELLAEDGIMVLQAITFPDPFYRRYRRSMDFTKKHIFPGSLLLSTREVLQSLDRTGDLMLYHMESIGLHYARTLRDWRANFEERLDEVRALGFDEIFIRKWRYYLAFCEVGFANRYINDVQWVFSRPQNPALENYVGELGRASGADLAFE